MRLCTCLITAKEQNGLGCSSSANTESVSSSAGEPAGIRWCLGKVVYTRVWERISYGMPMHRNMHVSAAGGNEPDTSVCASSLPALQHTMPESLTGRRHALLLFSKYRTMAQHAATKAVTQAHQVVQCTAQFGPLSLIHI